MKIIRDYSKINEKNKDKVDIDDLIFGNCEYRPSEK